MKVTKITNRRVVSDFGKRKIHQGTDLKRDRPCAGLTILLRRFLRYEAGLLHTCGNLCIIP
ncbi:MAG: hypothetical protein LBQ77_06230 [Treponema sp.]|nr:hypothetical protein [Treponema sp.]